MLHDLGSLRAIVLHAAALLILATGLSACEAEPAAPELVHATALAQPAGTVAPATPRAPTAAPPSAATVTVEPTPTAAKPAPTTAEIRRGIQNALDLYARAYNENDADALKQAVDQTNLPFRRLVQSRFQDFQRSFLAGDLRFEYTVADVEPRAFGFVLAHIRTLEGFEADWLFRQVDGQWVLSEPTVEQLGAPETTEHERFTFVTYPWADDINQAVIEAMETARGRVQERLGRVPVEKAEVRIIPAYGLSRDADPSAVAQYVASPEGPDRIMVYAPRSFLFGLYDPDLGWRKELENVLTHEYTHMAHVRSFENAGKLATWMSEGLAEHVSESMSITLAFEATRTGDLIPIADTESDVLNKQDLAHFYSLDKDVGLAYGEAQSVVAYIVETYGGLDAFWTLARAFDDTQDLDEALRAAFGVTYADFDSGWRAWLRAQVTGLR